ncbi:alpha/beta hydrolase-fold protein [bacterium]|nr:alpha/beta hydrolase-fold protein [bacterium]
MSRFLLLFGFVLFATAGNSDAQPPVRLLDGPSAPPFKILQGGESPAMDAYENYVIGPDYVSAPENRVSDGVPRGTVKQFTIDSRQTKIFNPGIARKEFGSVDPANPNTLIVETHEIDYERKITVYIPAQHQPETVAPFMVVHDGPKGKPNLSMPRILDNLIAQDRIPPIILIQIANGGGDAQGHQRGREYDNMSGLFAEYIETEVLPRVEEQFGLKLTKNPEARAVMGSSSGGSASLIMSWFRNDLYRRVLTTSGTFVNQAWPYDPDYPGGAWEFHQTLIPSSPKKPIRLFISVGDKDLLNPNVMRDGMHDWVEANHRMAKVLKAKGYEYQYLFCRNSGHGIRNAKEQFLPHAIEWVWDGYGERKIK